MLARQGVELSRSTLCDWMAAAADVLTPLYMLMLAEVLKSKVVQTDETRVPVLEPGLKQTKSGRLWTYVGDRDHPYTVYDYRPTKARDGPAEILKDYKGYLQADAANVFDQLYLPGTIVEVACWAHARRHFHDSRDTDAARAAEALARIREFYAIEDQARLEIAHPRHRPLVEVPAPSAKDRIEYRNSLQRVLPVPLAGRFVVNCLHELANRLLRGACADIDSPDAYVAVKRAQGRPARSVVRTRR